ncbi:MAG: hypothetical protein ACI9H8_000341 [Lysobacterales bacterium]|jgi:hypothetical protein
MVSVRKDMINTNLKNGDRTMKLGKENGLTILGFLIVMSLVMFFVFIGMRITPIYLEYYGVVNAMDGVAAERGSARYSPFEIKRKFLDRLYLSYAADNVKEANIKIVRRSGVHIRIVYEVRKPMMGNLDVVASFDRMTRLAN